MCNGVTGGRKSAPWRNVTEGENLFCPRSGKAKARASELNAQLMLAPRTFVISFFFARLLQVVSFAAIEAYKLLLFGNTLFKLGQRQSRTVPG